MVLSWDFLSYAQVPSKARSAQKCLVTEGEMAFFRCDKSRLHFQELAYAMGALSSEGPSFALTSPLFAHHHLIL